MNTPTEFPITRVREVLLERGFATRLRPGMDRLLGEILQCSCQHTNLTPVYPVLGIQPTTLISRFRRAELPSPKAMLYWTRLTYAAWLFDDRDRTIADAAWTLRFASAQAFGRQIRCSFGMTASEFRARMPFNVVLDRFANLLAPHQATWRWFDPLSVRSGRPMREIARRAPPRHMRLVA